MCGICGFALRDVAAPFDEARLRRMTDAIIHRGPDDEGLEGRAGVALGFRRLSIIDLAGGHQPIWNEERDIAVLCNGEIYNFKQLRADLERNGHRFRTHSDAETLVHLYEEEGPAFLHRLVGMFAICIVDFRKVDRPRVFLARDRLGIKPLYWGLNAEGLFWGSEPKAVLASGAFPREIRAEGLVDYFVQGFSGGVHSIWQGLQRLEPAHWLEWDGESEPRIQRYWDLPLEGEREDADPAELLDWIDRIVGDRLVADVPLGAFLSGGIDSSAVVTSMAAASSGAVRVCSVGFHEKSHNELGLARATAERLGLDHHTQILEADPAVAMQTLPWFFDEPLADSSTVPTWLVSKMAREHVTVALSGDGGDEIFAGYRRQVFDVAENRWRARLGEPGRRFMALAGALYPRLAWAPRVLRARSVLQNLGREAGRAYYASMTQLGLSEVHSLLAPDLREAVREHDPYTVFGEHYEKPSQCDPLYRAQYADFKTWLPDRLLVKTDRASMAVSLEVRVPLLDHRFVERYANLATRFKVHGGRGKHALREALRSRLPADVLDGKKRGFDTPLAVWLRGPLGGEVRGAIERLSTDVFDRSVLVQKFEAHQGGFQDHSQLMWSLLVWDHWWRRHEVGGIH